MQLPHRVVLFGAVLVGAVAVALWLDAGAAVPIDAATSHDRHDVGAAADAALPRAGDDSAGTARNAVAAAAVAVGAGAASGLPEHVPIGHVLLRVVDAASREPVPGADVVADLEGEPVLSPEQLRAQLRLGDPFERMRVAGQATTTDVNGYASVRCPWGSVEVAARHGDRYGAMQIDLQHLPPTGAELLLEPDQARTVRVVDAGGTPAADVPLALRAVFPKGAFARGYVVDRYLGLTDEHGLLQANHLQLLGRLVQPSSVEVFVQAPGLDAARVALPGAVDPVELRLPPHGAIRVRLVDERGRPAPGPWTASLSGSFGEQRSESSPVASTQAEGPAGVAVFPFVGLGGELVVDVWRSQQYAESSCDGPVAAGEVVDVELTLPAPERTGLRGRLIDDGGTPMSHTRVTLIGMPTSSMLFDCTTDASGRFAASAAYGDFEEATGVRLVRYVDYYRPTHASDVLPIVAGAEREVGDVTMVPGVEVAAGRIVGEARLPADLQLFVETRVVDDNGAEEWSDLEQYAVALGPERTFNITLLPGAKAGSQGRTRLYVNATGCLPVAPVEFRAGQRDVEIELRSGTRVVVDVVLEPELLVAALEGASATFVAAASAATFECHTDPNWARDGVLHIAAPPLEPGRYAFRWQGQFGTLAEVADIDVGPGLPMDSRLRPLDLRGQLQLLQVRLGSSAGTVGMARIAARPSVAVDWSSWLWIGEAAEFSRAVRRGPHDIVVTADRMRPKAVRGVEGLVDVTLEPAAPVRVVFVGWPESADTGGLRYRFDVSEGWYAARQLPDGANPVRRTEVEDTHDALTVLVAEPLTCTLRVVRGRESTLLVERVVRLDPAASPVRVELSADEIARLQQPTGR